MSRSRIGSKREVRPGVWEIRVTRGRRQDGKPRSVSRTVRGSESDADRAIAELYSEMGGNAALGTQGAVRDFWPAFIARCEAKGLTRNTIRGYEYHWRRNIEPTFGGMRWSDVTYPAIQQWAYGMGHDKAKHAARVLKRFLNCAVDAELIDRSPLDRRHLDYPVKKQPDLAYAPKRQWGAAEVSEAMSRLQGCKIEPLYLVLVGGGLRVEEALALEWSDLAFSDEGICHAAITKAWTPTDGYKGTKNEFSRRVVSIPDPFASRLEELTGEGRVWPISPHRARAAWNSLFAEPPKKGYAHEYRGLLFGMPLARMKDMRSVHETLMQEAGVLDTVNARMHGRTNVQTGYSHYLRPDRALDDAARAFGEALL